MVGKPFRSPKTTIHAIFDNEIKKWFSVVIYNMNKKHYKLYYIPHSGKMSELTFVFEPYNDLILIDICCRIAFCKFLEQNMFSILNVKEIVHIFHFTWSHNQNDTKQKVQKFIANSLLLSSKK